MLIGTSPLLGLVGRFRFGASGRGFDTTPSALTSSAVPDAYEVAGDGVDAVAIPAVIRNAAGDPLPGKVVDFSDREVVQIDLENSFVTTVATGDVDTDYVATLHLRDANNLPIPSVAAADVGLQIDGTGNTIAEFTGRSSPSGQISVTWRSSQGATKTLVGSAEGQAFTSASAECDLEGGEVAPDEEEDWSSVSTIAQALARPKVFSTDYTYVDESEVDGLSLCTTDGDPWSGSGKSVQANIPIGANGNASGGGFGRWYANGDTPCTEAWWEVALYAAPGFSAAGSGGGSDDSKVGFNNVGDSYAATDDKLLISAGRSTWAKWGNQGLLDRIYAYPDTRFDGDFLQLPADIGDLGWVRYRVHERVGGAGTGIFSVEVLPYGGTPISISRSGYTPTNTQIGDLRIWANFNKPLLAATMRRCGRIRVWRSNPGWGLL